jgi:hypothetical protein
MTRDLRSVLEGFGHDEAHGGELAPAGLDAEVRALTARVRRRRVLRSTAVGIGAAAAVTIGALTVQAVDRPDAVPADPTPSVTRTTPVPSPSVTPTPTPTPTTEEPPVLGGVTAHPMLPPAQPLRAGMLESADDDWQLVTVEASKLDGGPAPVLYLVDPAGRHYEVPTPVALAINQTTWVGGYVEDWRPGSTTALVFVSTGFNGGDLTTGYYAVQDLLTGEMAGEIPVGEDEIVIADLAGDGTTDVIVTRRPMSGDDPWETARLTEDGAQVAAMGPTRDTRAPRSEPILLSPDRSMLVVSAESGPRLVRASDLADLGPLPTPGPDGPGRCGAWVWWDESRVVLKCAPTGVDPGSTTTAELWLVTVTGDGSPQLLGETHPSSAAAMVGERLVTEWSGDWTALDSTGAATPITTMPQYSALVRGAGDRVEVYLPGAWVDDEDGDRLALVDPASGEQVMLGEVDAPGYVFTVPVTGAVRRY